MCSRENMRALLEGRMWQRRRPVRLPEGVAVEGWVRELDARGRPVLVCSRPRARPLLVRCPYGETDDWLYCRERHRVERVAGVRTVVYEADAELGAPGPWRSPVLLPRSAARLWLRVYDVRLQRLHELTAFDAHGEGVACPLHDTEYSSCVGECPVRRQAYAARWDLAYAPLGLPWLSNPWVWAISFTRFDASGWLREVERLERERQSAQRRSVARVAGRRVAAKKRRRRR